MVDIQLAKSKGFEFGMNAKFYDAVDIPKLAADSAMLDPNATVPAYMLTFANPRVIEVLTAPRNYKQLAPETKQGDWTTAFEQFRALEFTGTTTPYQDYDANGQAGINTAFPTREQYRFQTTIRVGDLENDMNAEARINLYAEKQRSAAILIDMSFNKYALYGVAGAGVYGLLNDPNLLPDIAPISVSGATAWSGKTAGQIMEDINKMVGTLYQRANGWIDNSTPLRMAIAPEAMAQLNKLNDYGVSVKKMLADAYANISIVSLPELANATSGNTVMLMASEINGQPVVEFGYSEKYRAHAVIRHESSMTQKISAGTFGAVVQLPFAIATMTGV